MTEQYIKKLHAQLKGGTSDSRKAWFKVGEYKKLDNVVGEMETCPAKEVHGEMVKLLAWWKNAEKTLENLLDLHVRLEQIQLSLHFIITLMATKRGGKEMGIVTKIARNGEKSRMAPRNYGGGINPSLILGMSHVVGGTVNAGRGSSIPCGPAKTEYKSHGGICGRRIKRVKAEEKAAEVLKPEEAEGEELKAEETVSPEVCEEAVAIETGDSVADEVANAVEPEPELEVVITFHNHPYGNS